jgi:hypothetical protein
MGTAKKMQVWANGVDEKYFDTISKENLLLFVKESEKFAYMLELLYENDVMMKNNPLMQLLRKSYTLPFLSDLLGEYAKGKAVKDVDAFWKDRQQIISSIEASLSNILTPIDFGSYTKQDIAAFYENISLHRNVWLSLFKCQELMKELDLNALKQSRF